MQRSKWVVTPAALGVKKGEKQDWRTLIRHTSPEIRAMFEQLEAYHAQARSAPREPGARRMSAKRVARQALAAAKEQR